MKKFSKLVIALLFAAAPAAFVSCEYDAEEIDYTVTADYSELLSTINSQLSTLGQKIDALNGALQLSDKTLAELIKGVNTNLETKLILIDGAASSQTDKIEAAKNAVLDALSDESASLEDKLLAIDKSLNANYLDLKDLLNTLKGDLNDKLDLIEKGIKDNDKKAEAYKEAILAAIDDEQSDLEDLIAEIQLAESNNYISMSEALDVLILRNKHSYAEIAWAVRKQLKDQTEDLQKAIMQIAWTALRSDRILDEKLEALEDIIKYDDKQIDKAIEVLNGTLKDKVRAIERAFGKTERGLKAAQKEIENAINGRRGSIAQQLEALNEVIEFFGENVNDMLFEILDNSEDALDSLDDILGAINNQEARLKAMRRALENKIDDSADDVVRKIRNLVNAKEDEIIGMIEDYYEMVD